MTTLTSTISSTAIDSNFPIPGQDNDTQGFRTNFATIKLALSTAKAEVEYILANVAVAPRLYSNLYTSSSQTGSTGQIMYSSVTNNPLYFCYATNLWQTIPTFANTAPSTASSTGNIGQVAYDSTHFYVCVATNTWVRTNLASW